MNSSIFDTSAVEILCTCKLYLPLCRTYFCRYCYEVRCSNCVTHEVDSYYCSSCLETVASEEANTSKNKCSNCFDCPSCGNLLSLRASVTQSFKRNDADVMKSEIQKLFYMACSYCRWTTRESNIPDRLTSTFSLPEYLNPNYKRIRYLVECFNRFATREKLDKERTKYASRKNYFFLMESSNTGGNRRRYSTQMRISKRKSVDIQPIEVQIAEPQKEINDINDTYFTAPFILSKVTNIEQRHRDPERQPTTTSDLRPIAKPILVKRSERCRKCDHNLCKPEIATNSTKFKINLSSVYHVPELRIRPLKPGKMFEFNKTQKMILTLINPAHRITTVKLMPITNYIDEVSTAKLVLPSCEIRIGAKNEILGFDEMEQVTNEFEKEDDPSIIVDRKQNKVRFNVSVTPMKSSGAVVACLQVTFDYKDATLFYANSLSETKEQSDISLRIVTYKLVFGVINDTHKTGDQ